MNLLAALAALEAAVTAAEHLGLLVGRLQDSEPLSEEEMTAARNRVHDSTNRLRAIADQAGPSGS